MERLPAEVVTPRLVLRLWRPADVAALRDAIGASLEHLRPWMDWIAAEPQSDEERARLMASWSQDWSEGRDAVYGVFHRDTVVGGSGLHRRGGPDTLEIGYWIHVDHLRRGYASDLSEHLTNAAFEIEGIDRVEIHHDLANDPSAAVPRSHGYRPGEQRPDERSAPQKLGIDCEWFTTRADWSGR